MSPQSAPPACFAGPPDDWAQLISLPRQVLVAAAAGRGSGTVAGLAAIAAGRHSDSPLVRATAEAIYAEHATDHSPPGETGPTLPGELWDVPARCRWAVAVLSEYAGPGDAYAYACWLIRVADSTGGGFRTVRQLVRTDGWPSAYGAEHTIRVPRPGTARSRFTRDLRRALTDGLGRADGAGLT